VSPRKFRQYDRGDDVGAYLDGPHRENLQELNLVFKNLNFPENFKSFVWEGSIAAGTTEAIPNLLKPQIPSSRIILRSDRPEVCDALTKWSQDYVYVRNTGGTNATNVKIVFIA
jgi:hypothetical protein